MKSPRFTESLLNIHEDVRRKHWVPIAFLPIYDTQKSKRPSQGYECDSARTMRLFHDCWRRVLGEWKVKTGGTHLVTLACGDNSRHQVCSFVGRMLGDQQVHITHIYMYISCNCANITNNAYFVYVQEHDKQSGEGSYACHRCYAKKGDFLSDVRLGLKSVESRRRAIEIAASGVDLPDIVRGATDAPVVEWGEDGSFHRPGPNSSHYEIMRERCGAHLVFNAFWLVSHFCVHQMLMRDGMHAIDLGIIILLIRAILRAFLEAVELLLKIEGKAAAKLEARFRNVLARRTGRDGQRYMQYMH